MRRTSPNVWIPMLRRALLSLCLAAPIALPARAQDEPPKDLLVTGSQLAALKRDVDASVTAGDCERALVQLPDFIEKANTHANLIYAGARSILENPQKNTISTALQNQMRSPLEAHDKALNDRNAAWVSLGDCMVKLGRPDAGAAAYLKALELISAADERPTWDRARIALWKLIGVIPQ